MRPFTYTTTLSLLLALAPGGAAVAQQPAQPATPAEAGAFMDRAEKQLSQLSISVSRAGWVADNFITDDTQELSAEAQDEYAQLFQKLALEARRFDALQLDPSLRRKFNLLKLGLAAPPPPTPAEASELTRVQVGMQADYGKGTYCRPDASAPGGKLCRQLPDLEKVLRESRDPAVLLDAWQEIGRAHV